MTVSIPSARTATYWALNILPTCGKHRPVCSIARPVPHFAVLSPGCPEIRCRGGTCINSKAHVYVGPGEADNPAGLRKRTVTERLAQSAVLDSRAIAAPVLRHAAPVVPAAQRGFKGKNNGKKTLLWQGRMTSRQTIYQTWLYMHQSIHPRCTTQPASDRGGSQHCVPLDYAAQLLAFRQPSKHSESRRAVSGFGFMLTGRAPVPRLAKTLKPLLPCSAVKPAAGLARAARRTC